MCVCVLYPGDRCEHRDKGPIELASERLIENSASGDWTSVHKSLMNAEVNVNVGDSTGHTALIGSAVSTNQVLNMNIYCNAVSMT